VEKILIINPFGIGDVLFTTPVISALKQKYPGSFIGYWCNERTKDLLKNDGRINRIFALSRGDIKRIYKGRPLRGFLALFGLLKEIRKERFEVAFDFSLDNKYGFLSRLIGIKKRVGFDYKNRGRFLTDRVWLQGYSGRHVIEHYFDLLRFIGIVPAKKGPELITGSKNVNIAGSGAVLGIAMGGGESWGKDASYKQWPARKFGQLAARLIKEFNTKIVLLGGAQEKALAEEVIDEARSGNITDMTGKMGLEELALTIKGLKMLICNDGGPLHMAVALGVSTVSIFGPVDERVYGPYPPSEKHIVVKTDLPCRPCYENFRFKGCFNNKRCLEDIGVDEVYGKVISLL
jgi:lipopolysaccharide heptosyltransferase II